MRNATTGQLATIASLERRDDYRVWIANATGTLVEYSDRALEVAVSASVEQKGVEAAVTLQAQTATGSLVPLMTTTGAKPIERGRRIRIDAATVAHSATPTGSDFVVLFDGYVDDPAWGGDSSRLVLAARDKWKEVADVWLESETSIGSTGGTAIQTVIQNILTTGGTGITLRTVGSPTTVLYEETLRRQSVGEAITYVADKNGWDLRWLWSTGDSDFRLTFYEPPRSNTTPDHTWTTDDYATISDVRTNSVGIRNVCQIQYTTGGSSITSTNTTSTGELNERRYMFVNASRDPQLNTSGAATTLGDAIVSDLGWPTILQSVPVRFFWPVELGDYHRFPANSEHYASAQDAAVVAYQHRFTPGQHPTTTLKLRGRASGGATRWQKIAGRSVLVDELVNGPISIPPGSDTILPEVDVATTQSGGYAKVTLTLRDPGSYIDAVSFESFSGANGFDFNSAPSGWSGYDATVPFTLTASAALADDFGTYIAYAHRRDLGDGSGSLWVRGLASFDRDRIPNLVAGLFNEGANIVLSHSGSEDLASIRYAVSTTGTPATGTAAAGTVVNGRSSDGTIVKSDLAAGQTGYVRAFGYSATGGAGNQSTTSFTGQVTRPIELDGPPSVEAVTYATGQTGGIALTITAASGVVNGTAFEVVVGGNDYDLRGGPSGWTTFDTVAPYTTTATGAIVPGHTTRFAYGVRYDLGDGLGNRWITGELTADADTVPNFSCALTRTGDGSSLELQVIGDDDMSGGGVRYLISSTGMPATGGIGAGTIIVGQASRTTIATGFTTGSRFVRVRGYETATTGSTAGAESSVDWVGAIGEAVPDGAVTSGKLADQAVVQSKIAAGAVVADKLRKGAQHYGTNVAFSSDAYNRIRWSTGVISYADGTTVSITPSGSLTLTSFSLPKYVYHDGSSATLSTTSNYLTLTSGEDNTLLCVARRAAATVESKAFFIAGYGTANFGSAEIANNAIDSNQIYTGAVTATKINVASLSAISVDAGTITAGFLSNATGTTYVNLDATGAGTFIQCGSDLTMAANGTATFGGEVTATNFSASVIDTNDISLRTGSEILFAKGVGTTTGKLVNNLGDIEVQNVDLFVGMTAGKGIQFGSLGLRLYGTGSTITTNGSTNFTVQGDLHAGGGLTVDGNVRFGNATGDTVTVSGILDANSDAFLGGASGDTVGFYGSAGSTKPTITGSRGSNVALADLLNSLAGLGLITNSTSA